MLRPQQNVHYHLSQCSGNTKEEVERTHKSRAGEEREKRKAVVWAREFTAAVVTQDFHGSRAIYIQSRIEKGGLKIYSSQESYENEGLLR